MQNRLGAARGHVCGVTSAQRTGRCPPGSSGLVGPVRHVRPRVQPLQQGWGCYKLSRRRCAPSTSRPSSSCARVPPVASGCTPFQLHGLFP